VAARALSGVQGDDEFAAEWRVVVYSHFLKDLLGNANVTEVHAPCPLAQGQGQAQGQRPLGVNALLHLVYRRVYAEDGCPVLVGPVHNCFVPRLISQKGIFMTIQAVDH